MRVDVLVIDGVFDLGLSSVLDTLTTARALTGHIAPPRPRFDVRVVGVRRRVATSHGLRVPVETPRSRPDVVVVPALGQKTHESLKKVLVRPDLEDVRDLLRSRAQQGIRCLAACTGTFVLASTGLLDGGRATTSWWLAPAFRRQFGDVELDASRMVVESGPCVTAAAALAHLDLTLWLIRRVSPALATLASRYLLIEPRSSVALHAIPDHLAHQDPTVEAFERWARENLSKPFRVAEVARVIGTSPRTLARRLRATLGKTPVGYLQDLRVERALHRLRTSDIGIEQLAAEVGYADGATLRALLRRKTGRGVRELRR